LRISVSVRINFDFREAQRTQMICNLPFVLVQETKVSWLDLNAGKVAVMTHAHLLNSEPSNESFSAIHLRQRLQRDRRAVRNSGRKARERGLVPGWQTQLARQVANLGFGKLRLDERRTHAMLNRGGAPWASILQVIEIKSVQDGFNSLLRRECFYPRIHFRLAEVTAVRSIREIIFVLRFEGPNDHVTRADLAGKHLCLFQLTS